MCGSAHPTGFMHTPPNFFRSKIRVRIAALFTVSLMALSAAAPAADALTNAATKTVGRSVLGGLFKKRSRVVDNPDAPRVTAMERVNRSILGLPLGFLRMFGKGASRMVNKTVSDHIRSN